MPLPAGDARRACLDWSERRHHLGALAAALLDYSMRRGWAKRVPKSRVVTFTKMAPHGSMR
jgi:hypothetical protein